MPYNRVYISNIFVRQLLSSLERLVLGKLLSWRSSFMRMGTAHTVSLVALNRVVLLLCL